MPPRILRTRVGTVLALALAVSCAAPRASTPPVLTITATDSGFVLPLRVPAGLTQVRLLNRGNTVHEGILVHFRSPGSAAAYADSYRAGVDFPANAEDVGGPGLARPGDTTSVWLPLDPGHYAVLCFYSDHLEKGAARDFDVVAPASRAVPPATDMEVHLIDYAFDVRGRWTAGKHVIRVVNDGTEPHEFDPYRLADGKTVQDFFTWREHGRKGESPAMPLGGSGSLVRGREVWLPMTLTPGRYFMFCEVPSKNGMLHYKRGMYQTFVVPGS